MTFKRVTVLLALSLAVLLSRPDGAASLSILPSERTPATQATDPRTTEAGTEAATSPAVRTTTDFTAPTRDCQPRGCVHSGAFGLSWKPDPCTVCFCNDGAEICSQMSCPVLDCFGYPKKTANWSCCPVCDFGVADNECAPVPKERKGLYVGFGDESCHNEVIVQGCNKDLVFQDGQWMKCVGKKRNKSLLLRGACNSDIEKDVQRVVYKDVSECFAVPAEWNEVPQDYDPNPYSCTWFA